MSAIIFFVNFDSIAIYKKKGLVTPCHEMAADTVTFLDIFFVELSKFLSQIDKNFRSEIFFTLRNNFSDHMDVIFKSLSKRASAGGFSSVSGSFIHLWCFQALELFKVSFFRHSPWRWPIDSVCLTIFLGAKCVWGRSSCEQANSSIKS